jgi:hypothetical protein
MWLKVLVGLAIGAAGVLWWQTDRAAREIASCNEMVSKFEVAYTGSRPVSEVGPSDLRTVAVRGRTFCAERKFAEATRLIRTAGTICFLNNGCKRPAANVVTR